MGGRRPQQVELEHQFAQVHLAGCSEAGSQAGRVVSGPGPRIVAGRALAGAAVEAAFSLAHVLEQDGVLLTRYVAG